MRRWQVENLPYEYDNQLQSRELQRISAARIARRHAVCSYTEAHVMWHRAFAVSVLLVAAPLVLPQARGDAVQQAVQQGVDCLKQLQAADGSWPTHHAGATALVGLPLLECDVPASDAAVQGAASYLRNVWTEINDGQTTYAISLVILFLDRLGDSSVTVIIQPLTPPPLPPHT